MKTMYKSVFSILVFSVLAACSGGGVGISSDDQITSQQQKDNEARARQYSYAAGTYEGTVVLADGQRALKASMFLFVVPLDAGKNADGTPKTVTTLEGRFQLDDYVSNADYVTLVANYVASTGDFTMSAGGAATAPTGTDPNALQLEGKVQADTAAITVKRGGRNWGTFTATRTSATVNAPAASDDVERRERFFRVYRQLAGSYTAALTGQKGDPRVKHVPLLVEVSVNEIPSPTTPGVTIPTLGARVSRLDDTSGSLKWVMSVGYDQLSGRISMTATAGGAPAVPGSNVLTASGTWSNGNMDLTVSDAGGYIGEFKAQKN